MKHRNRSGRERATMEEEFDTEIYDYRGNYRGLWKVGYDAATDAYALLYPLPPGENSAETPPD